MDYKEIKINGQKIDIPGIFFTKVEWRKLSVSDSSRNIEGMHSRVVSPTFTRVRIITIEGIIERIDGIEKAEKRLKHLINLFSLQTNLVKLEEKEFFIKDIFGNDWKIFTKIKEPFEYFEGNEDLIGSHYNFRVVLESTKSPIYKSLELRKFETEAEGFSGGFHLGISFESDFHKHGNSLKVKALNNIAIPLKFEIDILGEIILPLKIENVQTGEFFALDNLNLNIGDKIIVDTENFIVTKNGENIIDKRVSGSTWLKSTGDGEFYVHDKINSIYETGNLKSKVYFSDFML